MSEPIIALRGVGKRYGDTHAVRDVTLTLDEGTFLTLLGPSGSGKTTVLRLLAGIIQPDAGVIAQNGRIVAGNGRWLPPEERSVGLVFQDYALFPHLDVAGNIGFGLRKTARKARGKRVDEMLALVGMSGFGARMPHELSGGQQQRVALARALAPAPNIMLLDEPFSNLDTALRVHVRAEVRSILRTAGTTTIFVTHDQEEALSLSDKVAVMLDGQLQQVGTPDEIYTQPVNKTVAAFIGEANFIAAQAEGRFAQSALGPVQLLEPAQGAVQLLIRPEALRLSADADASGVPALVQWDEYYGHSQRIGLTLADGTELIARTNTDVIYERGQRVHVSLSGRVCAY